MTRKKETEPEMVVIVVPYGAEFNESSTSTSSYSTSSRSLKMTRHEAYILLDNTFRALIES